MELPFVFIAGILGTAHCLGMCGPLVLSIGGGSSGWSTALLRHLAYTGGRIFTYGVLGAAAGFCGARLLAVFPSVVNVPALLAIAAGLWLVYQGLATTGLFTVTRSASEAGASLVSSPRLRFGLASAPPCLAGGMFASLLRQRGTNGAFLAGMFTGLLPCGLLYGMLALATASHSLWWGAATMVVFGLGTAPSLILVGVGGKLLSLALRRKLYAAAACCLLVTGLISVARGVSHLKLTAETPTGCPLCRD